jgi:hypothetical protein
MDALIQDVRYGTRQLFRQRGSSLVAIVTLALGIGVSTAIFSVIDATMLRPVPYANPAELVEVSPEEMMPDGRVSRATASMEDMRSWQKATDVFSFVAGTGSTFRGRIVEGAEPERIRVEHFTEDYLPMYGVTPLIGRNFSREDTESGAPLVALLGYGYWQSRYAGRENVIGESVRFDTESATIIGVLPPWFNASTPVTTPLQVTRTCIRAGAAGALVWKRACVRTSRLSRRRNGSLPGWKGALFPMANRPPPLSRSLRSSTTP